MGKMRRFLSLALVLVMVLALGTTAFAADTTYNISAKSGDTHTYEVYQIFKGEVATVDGVTKLSNVVWGANGTGTVDADVDPDILTTLQNLSGSDAEKLAEITKYANLTGTAIGTVKDGQPYPAAPGYYLIKDVTDLDGKDDTASLHIVQVVNQAVEIVPKKGKPTVEKKVQDINDSTDGNIEDNDWQDSADHDIGDMVPFQLTGTLPSDYGSYKSYTYKFNDTLSDGLTYQGDAKVYVVNGTGESQTKTDVTSAFEITPNQKATAGGGTLTVVCNDLKKITGATIDENSKIVVEYTAELNSGAVIGAAGNPNRVNLEYSNNPNVGGEGDTGKTPDDIVIVFTFQTVVNKIDENKAPLTGAEFTLEKKQSDGTWKSLQVVKAESGSTFTMSGLDDGQYRLTETATPAGYNSIDPIYFGQLILRGLTLHCLL